MVSSLATLFTKKLMSPELLIDNSDLRGGLTTILSSVVDLYNLAMCSLVAQFGNSDYPHLVALFEFLDHFQYEDKSLVIAFAEHFFIVEIASLMKSANMCDHEGVKPALKSGDNNFCRSNM